MLDAHVYRLPLPDWLLRAQAKLNQAILHAGQHHREGADLADAIVRAVGLSKPAFNQEARDSELLFMGHLIEQFRDEVKAEKGELPSLTWTYAELVVDWAKMGWTSISERTLRRAWERLREARTKKS